MQSHNDPSATTASPTEPTRDSPTRDEVAQVRQPVSPCSPLLRSFLYASHDWYGGTRNIALWWTLAQYDVVLRYRSSMLGPLWITISMAAMLMGMGPLYSVLFNIPRADFFPHLTLGIIFWTFISATLTDSCSVFINAARYLKQGDFSATVFAWRTLARNTLYLAHHIILFIPVSLWYGTSFSWNVLYVLPGLFVVFLNLHLLTLGLGILCARFRDIPQMVTSGMQLMMFVTPVFWVPQPSLIDEPALFLNPFTHLLDIVREPLLGRAPSTASYRYLAYATFVNAIVSTALFGLKRYRLNYWI